MENNTNNIRELVWTGNNVKEFRKAFDKNFGKDNYVPNFFTPSPEYLVVTIGNGFRCFYRGETVRMELLCDIENI